MSNLPYSMVAALRANAAQYPRAEEEERERRRAARDACSKWTEARPARLTAGRERPFEFFLFFNLLFILIDFFL